MSFTVLKIRLQEVIDILKSSLVAFYLHVADGPSQEKRNIALLVVIGSSVVSSGLVVLLHQSQAVAFPDVGDMFVAVETDGSVEVGHRLPVLFELEVEFASVDVGLVVFGVVFYASVQLNNLLFTIYSVSAKCSVFL